MWEKEAVMTMKQRKKKPRVWKAWAKLGHFSMKDQFLWIDKEQKLKESKSYVPVTITERKSNVQRAK